MSEVRLHYETAGSPAHPAVLFLHGFMGSAGEWTSIVREMRRDFHCIMPDLPGHGRSTGLPDPRWYSMDGTSELLRRALDEAEIDEAHVVGYSMGGRTALYFALHFASSCRKLVLESASPGLGNEDERRERRGADEATAVRLETEDFEAFLDAWYRQPVFETLQHRREVLLQMIGSKLTNDPVELARSLRGMGTGTQPSVWDTLVDIQAPCLALSGALDGKYVEIAERMAVLMSNMRAAIIPNAGHNLHAECPAAFIEIVRDFLKKPA